MSLAHLCICRLQLGGGVGRLTGSPVHRLRGKGIRLRRRRGEVPAVLRLRLRRGVAHSLQLPLQRRDLMRVFLLPGRGRRCSAWRRKQSFRG